MSTIKPRQTHVVIYQGDDVERLSELQSAARLARARMDEHRQRVQGGAARLGDGPPDPGPAEEAYDAFVTEAAERAVEVQIRALGRSRWRDLFDEHPPRMVTKIIDGEEQSVEHPDDEPFGVNTKTFPDKLLAYDHDGVATIVEPTFPTAAARQAWLDDLSAGDFDKLWATAYYLNTSLGADPKASRYSNGARNSDET